MPDKRLPSIRDVAALAGVSVATVSNVLSGRKRVSEPLMLQVAAAVQSLGYSKDRAAAQLRSGKTRVIAVLVPSLDNPFFTSIIAAIEFAVRSEGYDIIVASCNDDETIEHKRLAALLSWRPSGVVILPCNDGFSARALLENATSPSVFVDRIPERPRTDTVTVDNAQAGLLAADHLIQLGHRHILVVASTLQLANIRERHAAIERACHAARLPAPRLLEVGLTLEAVAQHLGEWLLHNRLPSAIIALTNFATIGVMAGLSQASIRIPDDLSLVGFDDYMWMQAASPSITAIRQPVEQLGAEAWLCLRERIEAGRTRPKPVRLACTLQIRGSSGPVVPAASASAANSPARRTGR